MITEDTMPVEKKGLDTIEVPNCLHVIMLAEPGFVVPAGQNERRYAVFEVSNRRQGDREYFRGLHKHIGVAQAH
jgi:hypothetical protein